ncbi:outer membrane lipoprotein-sorting protein [Desulfovibrio sp. Huiquan2017]|uniref:outer membrane lipoprotein-sorting protein n=1 Tax=Desulfovibrio sp. Huiquan2017 TaxID=2816861 RepID=UPI001A93193B|nr:outer membrane lipoprotein-sorting protein [Desulfovibrio sp. Huiquan2017]
MKNNLILTYCMVAICLCAMLPTPTASAADLQALVRNVEQQYNGDSSHVLATMHIVTEQWSRTISMEGWSLGRKYSLTRISAPAKEKGVATLKSDREVWNYLSRVDRVIKIPPSMLGASWMGSHISNDDLVKANHVDLDYDLTLMEETDDYRKVLCTPKADAAVIWGKIIYTIRKPDDVPLEIEYFDDLGDKVRTIGFDDVRQVDGHTLPMDMIVLPEDKPGEKTVLHYDSIDFDIPLKESFFSLRNLKKR